MAYDQNYYESSSDDSYCSNYNESDEEMVWYKYCPNQMPRFALHDHITRKHFVQCNLCKNLVLESNWQRHINR